MAVMVYLRIFFESELEHLDLKPDSYVVSEEDFHEVHWNRKLSEAELAGVGRVIRESGFAG